MITIYRCVFKACEDYKSLENGDFESHDICTIFPDGVENAPSDLAPYQRRICEVFAESDPRDLIIFNGPSWLIALVGYHWYSDEYRTHHNVLVFDKEHNRYKRLTQGAIDDY